MSTPEQIMADIKDLEASLASMDEFGPDEDCPSNVDHADEIRRKGWEIERLKVILSDQGYCVECFEPKGQGTCEGGCNV